MKAKNEGKTSSTAAGPANDDALAEALKALDEGAGALEATGTTAPLGKVEAPVRVYVQRGGWERKKAPPVPALGARPHSRADAEHRWLRWLIGFSQEPTESIEKGNWEPAMRQFVRYAAPNAEIDFDGGEFEAAEFARHLHSALNQILINAEWESPELVGLLLHVRPGDASLFEVTAGGSYNAVALFALSQLLARCGHRLRRCPECDRIFAGRGKQVFCSERCTNRKSAKTFIEKTEREAPQGFKGYRRQKRLRRLKRWRKG
jgi:hypothetical protein